MSLPAPFYERDGIVIYHGDCLTLLPELPSGSVDAVVCDPPYGIGYEASRYQDAGFDGVITGDDSEFEPSCITSLGLPSVIWGGNNFAHRLPAGGWLCWDKRTHEAADKIIGSPFELAWCSIRNRFKIIRCLHGGAVNADGPFPRVHPTQKPIRVMVWSIEQVGGGTILDPFLGSGTTAVACIKTGRKCIGMEISEQYAEIAARRCEEAFDAQALYRQETP